MNQGGLCDELDEPYLVTIAPREVAGADVLEGVLDALLQRGHVRPVLPMLSPEVVSVEAGEEEGRDAAAGETGLLAQLCCGRNVISRKSLKRPPPCQSFSIPNASAGRRHR